MLQHRKNGNLSAKPAPITAHAYQVAYPFLRQNRRHGAPLYPLILDFALFFRNYFHHPDSLKCF